MENSISCNFLRRSLRKKAASSRKQYPPLNMVHAGVQILFTNRVNACYMQTQAQHGSGSEPMIMKRLIFTYRCKFFLLMVLPATSPSTIVPNVGIKLNVAYPPPFPQEWLFPWK
jgi:hypothetical protein